MQKNNVHSSYREEININDVLNWLIEAKDNLSKDITKSEIENILTWEDSLLEDLLNIRNKHFKLLNNSEKKRFNKMKKIRWSWY